MNLTILRSALCAVLSITTIMTSSAMTIILSGIIPAWMESVYV